jgi:hypothetical protein
MRRFVVAAIGTVLIALALAWDAQAHVLTFTNARNAAKARADAYARQPTRIESLIRTDYSSTYPHGYYAQAEWTTPGLYGINQLHIIALRVRCLHAHARATARRVCTPFAWVTDVFG